MLLKDNEIYQLVNESDVIIPIPSVYTRLSPHFDGRQFGFISNDVKYSLSDEYLLKLVDDNTYQSKDLTFYYIDTPEAYIIELHFFDGYYVKSLPFVMYGMILK